MAEKLAFEHLRRNRRAIHREERPAVTLERIVQDLRRHSLAGAGFAGNRRARIAAPITGKLSTETVSAKTT
ncbi:hypothetical protein [Caballeronia arationis]|uniref:hypothetical protein n=1 Tax=Caballeronia arationis TaxID=1777142 RepID=UPI001FC959D3|nr:hypothetical protein [Caballeronia arationis]